MPDLLCEVHVLFIPDARCLKTGALFIIHIIYHTFGENHRIMIFYIYESLVTVYNLHIPWMMKAGAG